MEGLGWQLIDIYLQLNYHKKYKLKNRVFLGRGERDARGSGFKGICDRLGKDVLQ